MNRYICDIQYCDPDYVEAETEEEAAVDYAARFFWREVGQRHRVALVQVVEVDKVTGYTWKPRRLKVTASFEVEREP